LLIVVNITAIMVL